MSDSQRFSAPTVPDEGLLDATAVELTRIHGLDDPAAVRWKTLERIERRSSIIFLLQADMAPHATSRVYYKAPIPPPYSGERRQRWIETIRAGLGRGPELEGRLATAMRPEGIAFSRTLAVDSASLALVTLEVPGEALGKPWRNLRRADRKRVEEQLRTVGRAATLIEGCTVGTVSIDPAQRSAAVARRIERVRGVLPDSLVARLDVRLRELDDAAHGRPDAVVYAHGDLSPTNILVGEQVGLIDFTWPAKVRGFDVAHLAFRLEYDAALPAASTAPLVEALLEGYGKPAIRDDDAWRYVRMTKLLKVAGDARSPATRRFGRAARAVAELESF